MSKYRTIGETVAMSFARATAEMQAAQKIIATRPADHEGVNAPTQLADHIAEAIDALLDAAGAGGGTANKRYVLHRALSRHDIEIQG